MDTEDQEEIEPTICDELLRIPKEELISFLNDGQLDVKNVSKEMHKAMNRYQYK